MKLTLTLEGERRKLAEAWRLPETEQYVIAEFEGAGDAAFLAKTLRALADTIDPAPTALSDQREASA